MCAAAFDLAFTWMWVINRVDLALSCVVCVFCLQGDGYRSNPCWRLCNTSKKKIALVVTPPPPPLCFSVSPSLRLSVCLFVCLSVSCVSLFVCLCLSVVVSHVIAGLRWLI